ncbi:MAG: acetolactate synthase small subunit [Rickettsiales bacterium]|nr:acetolactate synthase small subunit [Rickettsiales bacterium]
MKDIVYDIPTFSAAQRRHTLAVLVDNEFGVLARVIGLFSGRGYNIESLTVAEVQHDTEEHAGLSRITIVTSGTEMVVEQIKKLLERMVPVHKVHDLTVEGPHLERELALVKVVSEGPMRVEALKAADIFRARVVDATPASCIFELTGESQKIDAFMDIMKPLGLVEICRTGIAAISRGKDGI